MGSSSTFQVIQQINGFSRDWRQYFEKTARNKVPLASSIFGAHHHLQELRMSSETGYYYPRQDDDRLDELTSDIDDGENYDNVNVKDRIGNAEDDAPRDTKTKVTKPLTDDAITQLIKDAVDKHILLSPQGWDETLAQNQFKVPANEGMSAKVQKVRSPRGPPREPCELPQSVTLLFVK